MLAVTLPTFYDEVFEAAVHLPVGARLILPEVDWDDYERLVGEIEGERRLRITYDCGRLEIVSPGPRHGRYASFFDAMLRILCDSRGIELEGLGNTTWKKKALRKGLEADCCYYITNAKRVIGKSDIKLEVDPPPDIAVEVDITTDSSKKFLVYAALKIPEVWTYDEKIVRFHRLRRGSYAESESSQYFSQITGTILAKAIEQSMTQGQTKALRAFRRKIRSL
jgi:Uma2 family endonuclease